MRILVLGSGAREHALAWKLGAEPAVTSVVCAPGNAGIARSIETVPVDPLNGDAVLTLIKDKSVDLTVIGAEAPLARGLADRLAAEGRRVFGPTQAAAQLETSKAFAKDFMRRHNVPTARYRVCSTSDEATAAIRSGEFGDSLVVKADGLAAGKGVVVADDRSSAEHAVRSAMLDRTFGDAGSRIVLEERLSGPEVSFFVIADGETYVPLLSAQDHKRVFDDDEGPNTGGMGAFAPSPLITLGRQQQIEQTIVGPVLDGMAKEGTPFRGCLYCGLMLTSDGPKVIEFNVRFGDPEAQAVLPILDRPLGRLLWGAADGRLTNETLNHQHQRAAVGVVLAARGYPGELQTGDPIAGLERIERECPEALVFFSGVAVRDGRLITTAGRVMTIVSCGPTHEQAMRGAYEAASRVHFDGMHYRRDIGRKVLQTDGHVW
ncbi:MAG: phosphoribosylamine--glycine ligase [Vicinamibacterales bacterium]